MILSLSIHNIIFIDKLEIDFKNGLNVFTGETGAGKSIIMNSISLALGAKSNPGIVKNNKDKELFDLFKKLDNKENHQFFKTNCKEALYFFLSSNKDQVFKIDQSSIKKIDNCESFLEEKKNSLIIFENFFSLRSF